MRVSYPNARQPSEAERQSLERLRSLLNRATNDGKISRQELDRIRGEMFADRKVTVDELTLFRHLVQDRLNRGELEYDW